MVRLAFAAAHRRAARESICSSVGGAPVLVLLLLPLLLSLAYCGVHAQGPCIAICPCGVKRKRATVFSERRAKEVAVE